MKKVIGIIPSRFKSTRFEGKPLVKIGDKTMIQMVYESCQKSKLLNKIVVATDDERIRDNVLSFGGEVAMTSSEIATGSDRCHAALQTLEDKSWDVVVNIQGDEPLILPLVIDACVQALIDTPDAVCSTPITEIKNIDDLALPQSVKVAVAQDLRALYFSRYPIPFNRNNIKNIKYWRHIGLYCYRPEFLAKYVKMDQTPMEIAESLEQLRILENGFRIQCAPVEYDSQGVDTLDDLEKVKKILGIR